MESDNAKTTVFDKIISIKGKMKRLFSILILFIAVNPSAYSTPQARDVLYWNNKKYYVFPFVDVEGRLSRPELETLNKKKSSNPPTANYRGYNFCFEICNDSLFLTSITDAYYQDITTFVLGDSNRRFLSDFSDTLYLGYGKSYFDDSFWTPVYESEITVAFKKGIVQWHKNNKDKTKPSPYTYNPQMFLKYLYSNIRWNSLNKEVLLTSPKVYVRVEIDSVDRIEKAEIVKSSGYAEFDAEAIRVLKTIPSVSVFFVCGKFLPHTYNYCIDFNLEKAKKAGVKTTNVGRKHPEE